MNSFTLCASILQNWTLVGTYVAATLVTLAVLVTGCAYFGAVRAEEILADFDTDAPTPRIIDAATLARVEALAEELAWSLYCDQARHEQAIEAVRETGRTPVATFLGNDGVEYVICAPTASGRSEALNIRNSSATIGVGASVAGEIVTPVTLALAPTNEDGDELDVQDLGGPFAGLEIPLAPVAAPIAPLVEAQDCACATPRAKRGLGRILALEAAREGLEEQARLLALAVDGRAIQATTPAGRLVWNVFNGVGDLDLVVEATAVRTAGRDDRGRFMAASWTVRTGVRRPGARPLD